MQNATAMELVAWPNPLRLITNARRTIAARREARRTAQALRALGGNTLKDMGICRSEIDSVVYGTPGERLLKYRSHDG